MTILKALVKVIFWKSTKKNPFPLHWQSHPDPSHPELLCTFQQSRVVECKPQQWTHPTAAEPAFYSQTTHSTAAAFLNTHARTHTQLLLDSVRLSRESERTFTLLYSVCSFMYEPKVKVTSVFSLSYPPYSQVPPTHTHNYHLSVMNYNLTNFFQLKLYLRRRLLFWKVNHGCLSGLLSGHNRNREMFVGMRLSVLVWVKSIWECGA